MKTFALRCDNSYPDCGPAFPPRTAIADFYRRTCWPFRWPWSWAWRKVATRPVTLVADLAEEP